MKHGMAWLAMFGLALPTVRIAAAAEPIEVSGIYPQLAFFNNEGECGTGAVVPWADRLWVITYAPHKPEGSSDKLYEITPELRQIVRPESIGGTAANRMIHRESNQLFIGPYVIDRQRNVRTIPYQTMYGRLTGNARHLTDPTGKVYYATMEEGIYEVDVKTLAVTELFRDEQRAGGRKAGLPGYHGKGLYSGQGRLVYANNGMQSQQALKDPRTKSGVLAEWDGKADHWSVLREQQFTEVTGPGGIFGNAQPESDPIWAVGWDHRSVILECLYRGKWFRYRLPKGSHSYDGAHGWNTEWPRIREIDEKDLLMTMHGTLWRFPNNFSPAASGGIAPRSNYLKVVGDFTAWQGRVVFGCDDTAASEFLNKRKAKGDIAAPQSQSNLWFVDHAQLDQLGPAIGWGSVWDNETVKAGDWSDPFLFAGYDHRGVHLVHGSPTPVDFDFEVDRLGNGQWQKLTTVPVAANRATFYAFPQSATGAWVRVKLASDSPNVTVAFIYRNRDERGPTADPIFAGLAKATDEDVTGGFLRARSANHRDLLYAPVRNDGKTTRLYQLDAGLKLKRLKDDESLRYHQSRTAIPQNILQADAASVVFIDDDGHRWRLPRCADGYENGGHLGQYRVAREVATERDLFQAFGTFYELPARNAGGFAGLRPVATHDRMIHDFCSYRGLFIASGVADLQQDQARIVRSDDGRAAVWVGAVDDLWKLGKPRGHGGPWLKTPAEAGEVSDPYLMNGYDHKLLTLQANKAVKVQAQIEISGNNHWVLYQEFSLEPDQELKHVFPAEFSAYWIRFVTDADATMTAQFNYD